MQNYDVVVGGMFDNNTHYFKVSLNLVCFVFDDCSSGTMAPNVISSKNASEL